MREIQDDEIILLINKYLIVDSYGMIHLKENGFIKTEKIFRKENIAKELDYSEMQHIKDLKYILNDYVRLKTKELAEESLSQNLVLSLGPRIEQTFKQIEFLLSDYSLYRRMIENQISLLNEGYDVREHGNDPDPSTNDDTQKQDTVLSPHLQHSLSPDRPKEEDVIQQDETPAISSDINENGMDLPMEQYLHLYRTLPNILPDVINSTLNKDQPLESDSVVESIISILGKDPLIGDYLSSEPETQRQSEKHSENTHSSDTVEELDSKRTKKSYCVCS